MEPLRSKLKKLIEFIDNLTGDNVSVYAAQASFFLVISAIPLLMLIFSIIKLFINMDQQAILHTINSLAPAEISGLLTTVTNELFNKTSSVSVISITAVSTLWLASRGIMALYTGLNSIYHVPTRNYFYKRIVSVIYTLAFVAALILAALLFVFGNKLEYFIGGHSETLMNIIQFLLKGKIIIIMAYLTILFALFYTFLPKKGLRFKQQLPGAAFSAVAWIVFSFIYAVYINNFSNYSYVYGSLAAVVLLMLWLYVCMSIFLYGAQINKMIENGFFKK
ncbi:MAG: YihY/virulence factor BrkB family protein [Oscillospiraceae bacterium]|nr:YihY/virulence factor BrkB family protein [Oscillospiraceae bacterium]